MISLISEIHIRASNYTRNKKLIQVIITTTLLTFIISTSAGLINIALPNNPQNNVNFSDYSLSVKIIIACFIAPLLETIIFQVSLILFFARFIGISTLASILLSAIIFGYFHRYSLIYQVVASIIGFIYAFIFSSFLPNIKKGAIILIISHALHNSLVLILSSAWEYYVE